MQISPENQVFFYSNNGIIVISGDTLWVLIENRWIELNGRFAEEIRNQLFHSPPKNTRPLFKKIPLPEAKLISELVESEVLKPVHLNLVTEAPTVLFLELMETCNLKCHHCYSLSSPGLTQSLDPAKAKEIITEALHLGFQRIQLTGGEPLLHPQVIQLAELASNHEKKCTVEIFTNGTLLTNNLIHRLPRNVKFAFSFYSSNLDIHDSITGIPGSGVRTLNAMKRLLKKGRSFRVAIVVMEKNRNSVVNTREFLINLGINPQSIGIKSMRPVGRGTLFTIPQELSSLQHCSEKPQKHSTSNDWKWSGKVAISPAGNVYPCIFSRWLTLGNIYEQSLSQILKNPKIHTKKDLSIPEIWKFCSERLACKDCCFLAFLLMNHHLTRF